MANKHHEVTAFGPTQVTVANEQTRAELRLLAIRAYEHWLELEAKIEALETRLDLARRSSAPPTERLEAPGSAEK
jgi:BMFP domain-containing protein YqiC